jgi:hypothetical protein
MQQIPRKRNPEFVERPTRRHTRQITAPLRRMPRKRRIVITPHNNVRRVLVPHPFIRAQLPKIPRGLVRCLRDDIFTFRGGPDIRADTWVRLYLCFGMFNPGMFFLKILKILIQTMAFKTVSMFTICAGGGGGEMFFLF